MHLSICPVFVSCAFCMNALFAIRENRLRFRTMRSFLIKRPVTSFIVALIVLFLVIFLSNILNRPKTENPVQTSPRAVSFYNIGQTPYATFQAKIEKTGVIKIAALSGGVIQAIFVTEGDNIQKNTQLFTLSSNYQGGNAAALQAQIAEVQYKNVLDTFDEQNAIILKQRDIANTMHDNTSAMQKIASDSAGEVNELINANQFMLDQMNQQLTTAGGPGIPANALLAGQINQLQGAQDQLKQQIRSLNLQSDTSQPPAILANEQHDLTMQQLDIQAKSLTLNKEVSGLQSELAAVSAQAMYPSSPFPGTVQRIYVKVGQIVSPGAVLAEISATNPKTTAVADVSELVARTISHSGDSILTINGVQYPVRPLFVPTEATNGSLYSIIFSVPEDVSGLLSDGDYISASIPLGNMNTSAAVPFVPLDAVYQTQETSYVLIEKNGIATARHVTLGPVQGSFVEITQGLLSGDRVILDRSVIAGERVRIN